MRGDTQPAGFGGIGPRANLLAAFILLLALLGFTSPIAAQEGGNQAGLVVQFGDGSVFTACVDLGPDGQATGEEILRASGMTTVIDYNSGFGGGTLCKIGHEGCDFPTDKCFCQCTMKPGDPCIYWSYFHLLDGQWRYSVLGASSFAVGPGEVEGWAWGPAGTGTGVQPPAASFEQICGAGSETDLSPTPTPYVSPTLAAAVELPTAISLSIATPLPSTTAVSTDPSSPPTTVAVTKTPSPTAQVIVSKIEDQQAASAENLLPAPTPSVQQDEEGSRTANYVAFGLLSIVLVGGVILFRLGWKR